MNWDARRDRRAAGTLGVIVPSPISRSRSVRTRSRSGNTVASSGSRPSMRSLLRFRDPLIRDPELAALGLKGIADFDSLDPRAGHGPPLPGALLRPPEHLDALHRRRHRRERVGDQAAAIRGNLRHPGITWWARPARSTTTTSKRSSRPDPRRGCQRAARGTRDIEPLQHVLQSAEHRHAPSPPDERRRQRSASSATRDASRARPTKRRSPTCGRARERPVALQLQHRAGGRISPASHARSRSRSPASACRDPRARSRRTARPSAPAFASS